MKFVAFGLILGCPSLLVAASAPATAEAAEQNNGQKLRGGAGSDAQRELWLPYCPNGDGWYCGHYYGMDHLDEDTLHYCEDGHFYEKKDCAELGGVCKVAAVDEADYCYTPHPDPYPTCPHGPGKYCGTSSHVPSYLDDDTLYYCEHGHYKVITDCDDEYGGDCIIGDPGHAYCEVPSHPHPPAYARCPYGNGYYCGDSKNVKVQGLDPKTVYRCDKGEYVPYHNCTDYGKYCYEDEPGHPDYCKPSAPGPSPTPSCPYDKNGDYCGDNPYVVDGLDANTLYECYNGHYTPSYNCTMYGKECVVADVHDVAGHHYPDHDYYDYCAEPMTRSSPAPSASPSESNAPSESPAPTYSEHTCHPGGHYCGDHRLGQKASALYYCNHYGDLVHAQYCHYGCASKGKDSYCSNHY